MKEKKSFYFGIDIGGTNVKIGVFDFNKKLIDTYKIRTITSKNVKQNNKGNKSKELLDYITNSIDEYCITNQYNVKKNMIKGFGFAFPGPVVNNIVLSITNIYWDKKFDVVDYIKNKYGKNVKCIVGNDANMAAIAEYELLKSDKCKSMLMVTLGTGVGGGVIIDGKLVEGATGIAGEIGSIMIEKSNDILKENCIKAGCLDRCASGVGLINYYKKISNTNNDYSLSEIFDKIKKKEKNAILAFDFSMSSLAKVMLSVIHIFEPDVIVIGGGMVYVGATLITNTLKTKIKANLNITKRCPKILIAKFKNNAGIYGTVMNL